MISNHPLISHKYYALKSEGFTREYTRNNSNFIAKLWTIAPFVLVILNMLTLLAIQTLSLPISPFLPSMCLTFLFFIAVHFYLYNKFIWYHERKWVCNSNISFLTFQTEVLFPNKTILPQNDHKRMGSFRRQSNHSSLATTYLYFTFILFLQLYFNSTVLVDVLHNSHPPSFSVQ